MPVPGCRIQKNLQASFDRPMLIEYITIFFWVGVKIKILDKKRDFLRETNGPTGYLENLVGFSKMAWTNLHSWTAMTVWMIILHFLLHFNCHIVWQLCVNRKHKFYLFVVLSRTRFIKFVLLIDNITISALFKSAIRLLRSIWKKKSLLK